MFSTIHLPQQRSVYLASRLIYRLHEQLQRSELSLSPGLRTCPEPFNTVTLMNIMVLGNQKFVPIDEVEYPSAEVEPC